MNFCTQDTLLHPKRDSNALSCSNMVKAASMPDQTSAVAAPEFGLGESSSGTDDDVQELRSSLLQRTGLNPVVPAVSAELPQIFSVSFHERET
ncbi:toxin-antitoxin system, toxin component, PIN domain protein [Cooperia oncophora]